VIVNPSIFGQNYIIISKYPFSQLREQIAPDVYLFLVLIASIGLQFYGSYCGILLTDDSRNYLSAAESFRSSGEFKSPDGTYFVAWPPLFPMVLSLLPDGAIAVQIFNIILKCIAGVALYDLSTKLIESRPLRIVFLLVSLCGVHLTMISVFLWSELLFLSLMLANFLIAIRLNNFRFSLPLFLITGFLLCMQRNAGVFYVSGVSIWLLLDDQKPFKKRVILALAFSMFSVSGLLIWVNHIHSISDEFQFSAYRLFEDPLHNLQLVLVRLGELFVTGPHWLLKIVSLSLSGTCLYILRTDLTRRPELELALIISSVYLLGLSLLGKLDPHELDRLLSVFVPFVYLIVFAAMDKVAGGMRIQTVQFFLIVVVIWCSYPLLRTARNVSQWHNRSCFSVLNK
jgi:hypothetical protein